MSSAKGFPVNYFGVLPFRPDRQGRRPAESLTNGSASCYWSPTLLRLSTIHHDRDTILQRMLPFISNAEDAGLEPHSSPACNWYWPAHPLALAAQQPTEANSEIRFTARQMGVSAEAAFHEVCPRR